MAMDRQPESSHTDQLIRSLRPFVTPGRFERFTGILQHRTRHLTIVLEDIYQPHNASAVLRSCECFGIQDVHIIENRNKYEVNPDVALGSAKWLTLKKYHGNSDNTPQCLSGLKKSGYLLVAATPHKDDYSPETLPLDQKIALMFGTELEGLTPSAISQADAFIRIPMFGFTESLNISVSAAILMQSLSSRIRSSDVSWELGSDEKNELLLEWLKRSVKNSGKILDHPRNL